MVILQVSTTVAISVSYVLFIVAIANRMEKQVINVQLTINKVTNKFLVVSCVSLAAHIYFCYLRYSPLL